MPEDKKKKSNDHKVEKKEAFSKDSFSINHKIGDSRVRQQNLSKAMTIPTKPIVARPKTKD